MIFIKKGVLLFEYFAAIAILGLVVIRVIYLVKIRGKESSDFLRAIDIRFQ